MLLYIICCIWSICICRMATWSILPITFRIVKFLHGHSLPVSMSIYANLCIFLEHIFTCATTYRAEFMIVLHTIHSAFATSDIVFIYFDMCAGFFFVYFSFCFYLSRFESGDYSCPYIHYI